MDRRWLLVIGIVVLGAGLWIALAPVGGSRTPMKVTEDAPAPAPPPSAPSQPSAQPSASAPNPNLAQAPAPTTNPNQPNPAQPSSPAQAPATPPKPHYPVPERIGPVDDMKHAFESEPRDAGSHAVETEIETAYRAPNVPAGLFKAVVCRKTVCRIELDWTEERAAGYMVAFMGLMMSKRRNLAVEPQSTLDAQGHLALYAYVTRDAVPVPPPAPPK